MRYVLRSFFGILKHAYFFNLRVSALNSLEQQKAQLLETAKQAVQTLRADKIVLEDRLAKLAAERQAAKREEEMAASLAEDLRTVKEDLKQRDLG